MSSLGLALTEVNAAPKMANVPVSLADSCGKKAIVTPVVKKPDILAKLLAEKLALEAKIKALFGV